MTGIVLPPGKFLHPATASILRYFEYDHLSARPAAISKQFHDLAVALAVELEGFELVAGLRKLLEAKDCMVRAALDLPEGGIPSEPDPANRP